jgi:hypothetical protein
MGDQDPHQASVKSSSICFFVSLPGTNICTQQGRHDYASVNNTLSVAWRLAMGGSV